MSLTRTGFIPIPPGRAPIDPHHHAVYTFLPASSGAAVYQEH